MNQDQVKELLKKLDCRLPGGINITATCQGFVRGNYERNQNI